MDWCGVLAALCAITPASRPSDPLLKASSLRADFAAHWSALTSAALALSAPPHPLDPPASAPLDPTLPHPLDPPPSTPLDPPLDPPPSTPLDPTLRRRILEQCVARLEAATEGSLLHLLHAIASLAPPASTLLPRSSHPSSLSHPSAATHPAAGSTALPQSGTAAAAAAAAAVEAAATAAAAAADCWLALLAHVPPLLHSLTRLPPSLATALVSTFLPPYLFRSPALLPHLSTTLLPQLLCSSHPRLAAATAAHLATAVLPHQPHLGPPLLPHIKNFCAFSLFQQHVSQSDLAAVTDPALLLPARALFLSYLAAIPTGSTCAQPTPSPAAAAPPPAPAPAAPAATEAVAPAPAPAAAAAAAPVATAATAATAAAASEGPAGGYHVGGGTSSSVASSTAANGVLPLGPTWSGQQLVDHLVLQLLGTFLDSDLLGGREASQASPANHFKVQLWQALCLLAPKVSEQASAEVAAGAWRALQQAHMHPNVRSLIQLFVVALFTKYQRTLVQQYLLPALDQYQGGSYQVCVSTVLVGCYLLLEMTNGQQQQQKQKQQQQQQQLPELFVPLLRSLVPWSLHHRHAVRVPVQTLLHLVLQRTVASGGGGSAEAPLLPEADRQHLQLLGRFLRENEEVQQLVQRQGVLNLGAFDVGFECSVEGLLGVREGEPDGEEDSLGLQWPIHTRNRLPMDILQLLPQTLKSASRHHRSTPQTRSNDPAGARWPAPAGPGTTEVDDTEAAADADDADLDLALEDLEIGSNDDEAHPLECAADVDCVAQPQVRAAAGAAAGGAAAGAGGASSSYQLRPQQLLQATAAGQALGGFMERAEAVVAGRRRGRGLVVVGSLLENVPNLAGLCRTCESLGVEALVVASRNVATSEAFKRQSVTSERWIRLLEVGRADLRQFLRERKAEGYAVVAVEQAKGSVVLSEYDFPRRCVLLLGNEQNGVDVGLLREVDACVEIPMLGVTRSLNAHVSGAMAVWQYTQQWWQGV